MKIVYINELLLSNWKLRKTREKQKCSLHFSKKDIMQGIGFHCPYLHKNTVSFIAEKAQVDIATLKSEEIYNVSKSVSCSETCILDEIACDITTVQTIILGLQLKMTAQVHLILKI